MPFRRSSVSVVTGQSANPSLTPVEIAQQRLQKSDYVSLRDVRCTADADSLVLRGRVPSFYLKQIAQEIVRASHGVRSIVNEIEVDGRGDASQGK
jgi:osmotically-inducible protein OsmY